MSFKNKILIVGGTGFIGYHLAKKSLKKGWQVTSISTRPPRKKRYLSKVKYITPVPGGVGPMTIACLLSNTVECFKKAQS